jgi:glyoxylase-like metal-dependent hydrolase (beta-lactamase superfamily II)
MGYEVYAVRYGSRPTHLSENFHRYGSYGRPDADFYVDYYYWVILGDDALIMVDTGYDEESLKGRPGRSYLIDPATALGYLDRTPQDVSDVIVTHFHWDHIGNVKLFDRARITAQRKEFDFWTGRHGAHAPVAMSIERREIDFLSRALSEGRVNCIDGETTIAPGVSARLVGGHCPGQQVVVIDGETPVILASDALHLYDEMDNYMLFQGFFDLETSYAVYDWLHERHDADGSVIVAGHDADVMNRFPRLPGKAGDFIVRVA